MRNLKVLITVTYKYINAKNVTTRPISSILIIRTLILPNYRAIIAIFVMYMNSQRIF